MSIILLLIILAILVLSHEFGHFIVAKRAGIKVEEFGLGLPPRIAGYLWRGTLYSINWIPFGGFVRIYGEDPTSTEEFQAGNSFVSKSKPVQAMVLVAGIVCNLILALLLMWAGLQAGLPVSVSDFEQHQASIQNRRLIITATLPGSPADTAGVPYGAKILNFQTAEEVIEFTREHRQESVDLVTDKGKFVLVPDPLLGIEMDVVGDIYLSPLRAIPESIKVTTKLTSDIAFGIGHFLFDFLRGEGSLSGIVGPVGIAGVIGEASKQGFASIILITIILSLSLAVINLVPFPALDGGRLLFVIIEAIKGSPIKRGIANAINLVGFSLLILLMLVITYRDIVHVISA